jgi:hypothetical protein
LCDENIATEKKKKMETEEVSGKAQKQPRTHNKAAN